MPTDIHFAGDMRITVEEDPLQVAEALASAGGRPFRLTAEAVGEVYVNPALVAFWSASVASAEPAGSSPPGSPPGAPPEPEPPPRGRDVVTDIWGQPLRRKPRR